jgi:excisionase family DNA binding protein
MLQSVSDRPPRGLVKGEENDELLTEAELRVLLKASRTTIWRLRKNEGLPFSKVGGTYRYVKSDVLRWVKRDDTLGSRP